MNAQQEHELLKEFSARLSNIHPSLVAILNLRLTKSQLKHIYNDRYILYVRRLPDKSLVIGLFKPDATT